MTDPAERGVPTEPKEQGALTVVDVIEIAAVACSDFWEQLPEETREIIRDIQRRKFAALESAGFRIVSGETVTDEMFLAIDAYYNSIERDEFETMWRSIIAAAPLHGKG